MLVGGFVLLILGVVVIGLLVGSVRDSVEQLDPIAEQPSGAEPGAEPDADAGSPGDPDPAPDPDPGGDDQQLVMAALTFFVEAEAVCQGYAAATGNEPPDPRRFDEVSLVEVRDGTSVVVDDGLGERFVVDLGASPATISSIDGPDAVLPRDLSFGCPPELFLGTLDS